MHYDKKPRKSLSAILIIIFLLIIGRWFMPYVGTALVNQNQPQKSDLIVVLMGSGPDRMLEAVDLYKTGYAETILMVRNKVSGYDLVIKRGVKIPHDTELAEMVGQQLGVPTKAFVIVPGDAVSTQDEARRVRDYLQEHKDIDSLILVTSKYHSNRAKAIFSKLLGSLNRDIKILSCPSKYDDFNEKKWWKSREDLAQVFLEWVKLAHFYLWEQFVK